MYDIRTEQNRTNFISNVYIVHSFQHWHIQHYNTRDKGRKEKRKQVEKKVVISQFGESK